MRETFIYRRSVQTGTYLILLFAGILLGVLLVQTQASMAFAGIFSEYFLNQYAALSIDYKRLFRYVGSCRIGQYVFLVCCCALSSAPLLYGALIFGMGMTWGTVLSISILRLGMKGILICVVGIFPHIFFYIPAFGWTFLWILRRGNSRRKYLILSAVGFFFLFFGIVSEVYLNPLILQQILRKMS